MHFMADVHVLSAVSANFEVRPCCYSEVFLAIEFRSNSPAAC